MLIAETAAGGKEVLARANQEVGSLKSSRVPGSLARPSSASVIPPERHIAIEPGWDEIIYRGAASDGEFIAFWLKDRRVIAGMNVNVWDVNQEIQALIRSRQEITTLALSDRETTLSELVDQPTPPDAT